MTMHERDNAKPGTRYTSCGDCLQEFPAKTAQESAALAQAHVAAGCPKREIFVFGSNLAGLHGAGAARIAERRYGAKRGCGAGLWGSSYALPTKDKRLSSLPLEIVAAFVKSFLHVARENPVLRFKVTRVGCGLAGFRDEEIAPLFAGAPGNCAFDEAWRPWLGDAARYWGTFEEPRLADIYRRPAGLRELVLEQRARMALGSTPALPADELADDDDAGLLWR